jgi:hypothetical protein
MLLMFCGENKGNKKGRNPSKETDLNLCMAQKVLADTNSFLSISGGNLQNNAVSARNKPSEI